MAMLNGTRIISGSFRRSLLSFPENSDIRPTPTRIRETLFNWLNSFIEDSVCLDLFAGSGALGFEALSRGAKQVDFVENNRDIVNSLCNNQAKLASKNSAIYHEEGISFLKKSQKRYDIIFLDPPYNSQLLKDSLALIHKLELLSVDHGLIYVESAYPSQITFDEDWNIHRKKNTSTIFFALLNHQKVLNYSIDN